MSCGSDCCAIDEHFDRQVAAQELARYRRDGPKATTQELLDVITEAGIAGATVLDVGGGIGALAIELIGRGAADATVVDASAAYLAAANEEAERRQLGGRVNVVHGDFAELASDLPDADVVTLDKVVCCYPDMHLLLAGSTQRARRLYGIVYPRDSWWVRLAIGSENTLRRLRRKSFRAFVYSNAAIEEKIRREGFTLARRTRGIFWVVDLYARDPGSVGVSP